MSLGSLSQEAHENSIAMNRIGVKSNSGEVVKKIVSKKK
jgi:glutamate synthase domain-containing protein 2